MFEKYLQFATEKQIFILLSGGLVLLPIITISCLRMQ